MNTNSPYIQRRLMTALKDHLGHPEITMLVGPRQSGKTTILKRLEAGLRAGGQKTLWLNLDFEDDFHHVSSQGALLQKIHLELGKDGGVVFIDEIQRKENAGLFLKGLYDQDLPWKFIVSGSGSIELKEKISESLAGRKRMFELSTVSFGEFVDFKTGYRYTDKLREFFRTEPAKTDQLFREYLMYGGYPRVILAGTHQEKLATINEIYRSFLEKDIVYLLRVEKSDQLQQSGQSIGKPIRKDGQLFRTVCYSGALSGHGQDLSLVSGKNLHCLEGNSLVHQHQKRNNQSPGFLFSRHRSTQFCLGQLRRHLGQGGRFCLPDRGPCHAEGALSLSRYDDPLLAHQGQGRGRFCHPERRYGDTP